MTAWRVADTAGTRLVRPRGGTPPDGGEPVGDEESDVFAATAPEELRRLYPLVSAAGVAWGYGWSLWRLPSPCCPAHPAGWSLAVEYPGGEVHWVHQRGDGGEAVHARFRRRAGVD